MTASKPIIPRLGDTPERVLKAALNYNTAGLRLVFNVIGEGEWQFSRMHSTFEKCATRNGVPVIERVEPGSFDAWLLDQIRRGFVTVGVAGPSGSRNRYWLELHRATGTELKPN